MWHEISLEQVINRLKTNIKTGLNTQEVAQRLDKNGKNILPKGKQTPAWLLFIKQFNNPLVIILITAAGITAWLKEYTDTSVILVAVLVNTGIGFYQEYRSNNIFEKLKQIVRVVARVLRNGKVIEADAEMLVPGDIIILKPGAKIPSDARLINAKSLKVNEAILTGESVPAKKSLDTISPDAPLGDQKNMVFMGTVVEEGEGLAVITETGSRTEIGKIAQLTQRAHNENTPLQERMAHLGNILTISIGIAATIIFVSGLLEQRSFIEMFTLAVAVAVAAIPEGLPAALSIVLAVASQRILKQQGLVKHILAAETLGSATVICSDKTGTITEGIMKLEQLICEHLTFAHQCLALANEAVAEHNEKGWIVTGDPTDRAKMEFVIECGTTPDSLLKELLRINFIPFDPRRKYLASFHKKTNNEVIVFVTGAPETLINTSVSIQGKTNFSKLDNNRKNELIKKYEAMAMEGYRVIGLGYTILKTNPDSIEKMDSIETLCSYIKKLVFIGLAGIRDPIRTDVAFAMTQTRRAGVHIVMVTGDHKLTAAAIGKELGFRSEEKNIMEAHTLDTLSDSELENRIETIDIFSRVNPGHKMRIVKAWQSKGASVAMTGDGINDAPALKASDIGIAVGSATDVTKEAADLVLLNNSFSTIVSSIKQGRVAFDNIKKVTILLLITSFTELILAFIALIFKTPLPISAIQILWANLVQDAFPSLAMAFEPAEEDIMERPPVVRKAPIIDKEGMYMIIAGGIISDLILAGVFLYYHYTTNIAIATLQTFIFAVISLNILFYIFSIKSFRKPLFKIRLWSNGFILGAVGFGLVMVGAAIYTPALNSLLGTTPLPFISIMGVIALSLIKVFILELVKWHTNKKRFS